MSDAIPTPTVLRAISGPDEIDLFCELPYVINHELADDLASGRRRAEWMWVALVDGRVVARVAWWAAGKGEEPYLLDVLDMDDDAEFDRVAVGRALYETAARAVLNPEAMPPEYVRFAPPNWREEPRSRQAVEERMAVLEATGARLMVERLRLEWLPGTPIAPASGRLAFRAVRDDAELIGLMTDVLAHTLDAHSLADLKAMTPAEAAERQFRDEMAAYRTPRSWWRVAVTAADGAPVGFVIPARNSYNPIIAYVGVVPRHRGQGYVDELLTEGLRVLSAQDGVPRVRAATDVGNAPMAAAFGRAGFAVFERALHMAWQPA